MKAAAATVVILGLTVAPAGAEEFVRLPMHGFSTGQYFEYICPTHPNDTSGKSSNGVLLGFAGYAGVWVDSVRGICTQLFEFNRAGTYSTYTRRRHETEGPLFGNPQRQANRYGTCRGSEKLRVIGVRTHNYRHENALAWIEPLCSEETSYAPDLEASRARESMQPLAGSGEKGHGDVEYCPAGKVAVGIRGHADQFVRMFGLICGDFRPPPPPSPGLEPLLGTDVSFSSANFPGRYIRHRHLLGYIEPVAGAVARNDATFKVVSGLAGKCASFESLNYPGHFLRHQNFRVVLSKRTDDAEFRRDATFCAVKGLAGRGVSFESLNVPYHFIRHSNFELWLHPSDRSDRYKEDATFELARPLGKR